MSTNSIKVAMIANNATAPTKEADSVGYDVYAFGDHLINPGDTKIIPVGCHIALPEGHGAFVWDRSSFGSKGIHVCRQMFENPSYLKELSDIFPMGGVIEWSYRGQMGVILHNMSNKIFGVKHGQRIAQFIVQKCEDLPVEVITMEEYEKIPSKRGAKGFGSSDGQNTAESAQKAISSAQSNATQSSNTTQSNATEKK